MIKVKVELDGRDFIEVEYEGEISADVSTLGRLLKVSMVGCMDMMEMMQKMRRHFGADIKAWPVPEGRDHSSLLLREMILKLRSEWVFPYADEEICHCRGVSTKIVDQAIVGGAHTPAQVSRQTSASTNCGTCRSDVQQLIDFRLGLGASGKNKNQKAS